MAPDRDGWWLVRATAVPVTQGTGLCTRTGRQFGLHSPRPPPPRFVSLFSRVSPLRSPSWRRRYDLRLTGTSRRWRAVAVHKTPNLEPTPTGKEFPSLRFLRSKMATSNSNAGSHSSITYNSMTPQFVGRSHLHFERLGLGDLVRDLGVVQRFGK